MKMPATEFRKRLLPYLRFWVIAIVVLLLLFVVLRVASWSRLSQSRRCLTLVNPWNPVSETGYSPRLVKLQEGGQADRSCADALQSLLQDCREAGCSPLLLSAWRSVDDQLVLYDEAVQALVSDGMSPEEAEAVTAMKIARPGRSEHELGLAFDIVDADYPEEDEAQADTPTARWLLENAWHYGFILRYPPEAEDVTGYGWHPWHYRYVGADVAESIHSLDITLEEYLLLFYSAEAAVVYD